MNELPTCVISHSGLILSHENNEINYPLIQERIWELIGNLAHNWLCSGLFLGSEIIPAMS